MTEPVRGGREALMVQHRDALGRRAVTPLGSQEYEQLAKEIARIEVEIARIEEPPVELLEKRAETSVRARGTSTTELP